MNNSKTPKLTLVGAGPGDPDLITLKGINAIKSANVVLYDALANEELLDYCSPETKKIFVGKRAGLHHYQQHVINQMIVNHAKKYGHVVRLKGGDPYVFGRGHEELEYAEKYGLIVDIVPGVTSAISVPALSQIPLTKRGLNESFWVLTGTTRSGQLSEDIRHAAKSSATSVILMGVKKLGQILEIYSANGKSRTPAAVIQNGSTPEEKMVTGNVATLEELVIKNNIGSPAIIVIGETVALGKEKLNSTLDKFVLSEKTTQI
ncbi:MAG: uroporphyrinogen-III C-methyltransferase [Reichenbachiella sp.]|uniref:uroporphyrinogen-III C-methyltransferase n=1 Tax=Reichenbachiella sp. TaxID=2184521 RepID=UPI0032659C63